jgi:hypothetical protein
MAIALSDTAAIYIADTNNNVIRYVDPDTGAMKTLAGNGSAGYFGDGNLATSARLDHPTGITISYGTYIADSGNSRIRTLYGVIDQFDERQTYIKTVVGAGTAGYNGDWMGPLSAQLDHPSSIFLDIAGNIYIADKDNNRIRKCNITP